MLVIILSWICIVALAYLVGVGVHALVGRVTGSPAAVRMHFSLKCLSGLMGLSFISTALCLFMPLGLVSNLIDIAVAAAVVIFCRDMLRISLDADRERLRQMYWIPGLLFVLFVFIMAYLSLMASSHHDDGLYYSTSIRWLEEYGTVKGIANINPRIGFDSTWHILQANFGFRYLHWGLFNDLNGLIFLLVLLYSLGGMHDLIRGSGGFSSGVKALVMLPILAFHFGATSDVMLFNVNFISSSSPDIPACLLIFIVFLLFLEGRDVSEGGIVPGDLLVVLYSIWLCSIKFSSVPIGLLSCFVLWRLIRRRLFRPVIIMVVATGVFVIPWLIRNVMISGYLLFPLSSVDLFHVPWKLPSRDVKWHENAVKAFILSTDVNRPFDIPFTKWFPKWLSELDFIRKVIMGMVLFATVCYLSTAGWLILRRKAHVFHRCQREIVFIVAGGAGIFFWLTQAPDFRFGYGFLLVYCIFFLTALFYYFLESFYSRVARPAMLFMAVLALGYYDGVWRGIKPYFEAPISYRMPSEMEKAELGPGQYLYLVRHDDSWNAPLPAANANEYGALLPVYIGQSVKDGFRSTEKVSR
jgi:hypothetical protein